MNNNNPMELKEVVTNMWNRLETSFNINVTGGDST